MGEVTFFIEGKNNGQFSICLQVRCFTPGQSLYSSIYICNLLVPAVCFKLFSSKTSEKFPRSKIIMLMIKMRVKQ